jgi:hypothetical protein
MGVSPLTGKKRSVSTMSGMLAHIHTTKHQISPSDFKILSTATSEADLLIRESLFISKLKDAVQSVCKQRLCLHFGIQNIEFYSTTIYIFMILGV